MLIGEQVQTMVALPGIPAGATGVVKEVGRVFVAVELADGRTAYYAPRQLLTVVSPDQPERMASGETTELGFSGMSVPLGSHLCLLPRSAREVLDSAARYLAAGLCADEECLCAAPRNQADRLRASVAALGLAWGRPDIADRLVITDVRDMYLPRGSFTAEAQLRRVGKALSARGRAAARAIGYSGSVISDLPADQWWEYEMRVSALLRERGVTALCIYTPAMARGPAADHAFAVHPYVLKKRELLRGGAFSP